MSIRFKCRRWLAIALIACAGLVLATPAEAQVEKPQFKLGLVLGTKENRKLDDEVVAAATEAFVTSRRFTLVERQQLNAVLTEKDLQEFLGGQVNQKLTDVLGLDFIGLVGYSVDRVEALDGRLQVRFILNVRMIDVKTAAVVATLESVRSDLIQPTNPREAGKALSQTIRESFPPVGYVIQIDGKDVLVDLGIEAGIREGDTLEVVREGERLLHPVYGTEMPAVMKVIGELKVASASPAMATCRAKGGKFDLAVKNLVRLKAKHSAWQDWIQKVPLVERVYGRVKAKAGGH